MSQPDVSALNALIRQLQALVDRTINDGSRIGYFASLYTRITIAVRRAILTGQFADGEGVVRLVLTFARRYLAAIEAHQEHDGRISPPWAVALAATDRTGLSILQHMALAINAHINFDLGLSTFECFGARDLGRAKLDFMKVNDVLATVVGEVEKEIGQVSPILWAIERLSESLTTRIVGFGLYEARAFAWRFAEMLATADATERPRLIDRKAQEVALICGAITQDRIRNAGFALVAAVEVKDVRRVIRTFDRGLPMAIDPTPTTEDDRPIPDAPGPGSG